MATGTKICKYCGKEYPACKTEFKPGVFRWRDVACCEEHAAKYLEMVVASRSGKSEEDNATKTSKDDSAALVEPKADEGDEIIANEKEQLHSSPKKSKKRQEAAEESVG